jgi:hypothetical protein
MAPTGKRSIKPGWVRRTGSNLIAIGFGVEVMLFLWAFSRGMNAGKPDDWAINVAVKWGFVFSSLFWIGCFLWIVGGARCNE